ncbi:MAG: PD-(D/E)XK nuclease superfamily protein [bacterium]
MANPGKSFKDALIEAIKSWQIDDMRIYDEPFVGSRFVGQKRKIDVVVEYRGKTLGIEAKTQQTSGTAYQKLTYTIEDAKRTPISTIIVFSGGEIQQDVKAQLISSGIGLEVQWSPEKGFGFGLDILKQRIFIELGLDWLADQGNRRIQ